MPAPTLTAAQVAARLQLSPRTVRAYLRQGKLHGSRIDGGWLVSETDLRQWIDARSPRQAFASARGLLTNYPGTLSSADVNASKRLEAELEEATFDQLGSQQTPLLSAPDLLTAARNLTSFSGEHTLTRRIAGLQHDVAGLSKSQLSAYLADQDLCDTLFDSALTLKLVAAQINVVIHAAGMLLALPYILGPDETIKYVSLGAGNTGTPFDLETDQRVAEFKFVNWQGGSESIRQNQLFKDLFYLAEYEGNKRRCLYVLGKAHPLKFLDGNRALASVLSKNEALRNAFRKRYDERFHVVSEYYNEVKDRIEIHDLAASVPCFKKH